MENYEQKYKEALSRARVVNPGTKDYNIVTTIFPELKKKSDDERVRENAIQIIRYSMDGTNVALPLSIYKECINWLEKQSELTSKESKFKVGDWITFYGSIAFNVLKIETEYRGILGYLLLYQNGYNSFCNKEYIDERARLWTIQDAKDSDILVDGSRVFIYREHDDNSIQYYASFYPKGRNKLLFEGEFFVNHNIIKNIHPATKEQRDLLFSKMKEAGFKICEN